MCRYIRSRSKKAFISPHWQYSIRTREETCKPQWKKQILFFFIFKIYKNIYKIKTMASLLNENQPTDPISLLPYKKPTRVLPCGHTFNHSSLASLLDNNNGDATLACPVCRKRSHVRGVNEYPRNYVLEQQMDFQQEKEDKIRKEKMDLVIKMKIDSNEEKKKTFSKSIW